jgi:hypothetical protein
VLSKTGSDHLPVIAEEVSRVAELCIGQDMGTMSTATAFMEMARTDWFCAIWKNPKIHIDGYGVIRI